MSYVSDANKSFAEWLSGELNKRDWNQADLGRKTGLESATISNIVNGKRGVGYKACLKIAKALTLPPEEVYEAAGLLPTNKQDPITQTILYIVDKLPADDKREVEEYARLRLRMAEERGNNEIGHKKRPAKT